METNLKRIRESRGMTQRQLAESIGEKVATYGTWERGTSTPNIEQLVKCAQVLDCSADEILDMEIRVTFSNQREEELHRISSGVRKMKTRLKEARRNARMSQQVAAERLGVSLGTYRNWEQGRVVMNGAQLINAARLFNTNVDYLLMLDGSIEKRMDPSQELGSLFEEMNGEGQHALLVVARGLKEVFPRD